MHKRTTPGTFLPGDERNNRRQKNQVWRELRVAVSSILSLPLDDDTLLVFSTYEGAGFVNIVPEKKESGFRLVTLSPKHI